MVWLAKFCLVTMLIVCCQVKDDASIFMAAGEYQAKGPFVLLAIKSHAGSFSYCSGGLVKVEAAFYLITAAHCFAGAESLMLAPVRGEQETFWAWNRRLQATINEPWRRLPDSVLLPKEYDSLGSKDGAVIFDDSLTMKRSPVDIAILPVRPEQIERYKGGLDEFVTFPKGPKTRSLSKLYYDLRRNKKRTLDVTGTGTEFDRSSYFGKPRKVKIENDTYKIRQGDLGFYIETVANPGLFPGDSGALLVETKPDGRRVLRGVYSNGHVRVNGRRRFAYIESGRTFFKEHAFRRWDLKTLQPLICNK